MSLCGRCSAGVPSLAIRSSVINCLCIAADIMCIDVGSVWDGESAGIWKETLEIAVVKRRITSPGPGWVDQGTEVAMEYHWWCIGVLYFDLSLFLLQSTIGKGELLIAVLARNMSQSLIAL